MTSKLQTTGKYSHKQYRCCTCGHEHSVDTNHYGEVYSRCLSCGWKHPMESGRHECIEPLPEGWSRPEPWKMVRLGDICEIKGAKCQ
jgi:DNA-directed RNA polymerase subunit RPC12/RpoP